MNIGAPLNWRLWSLSVSKGEIIQLSGSYQSLYWGCFSNEFQENYISISSSCLHPCSRNSPGSHWHTQLGGNQTHESLLASQIFLPPSLLTATRSPTENYSKSLRKPNLEIIPSEVQVWVQRWNFLFIEPQIEVVCSLHDIWTFMSGWKDLK